jgi:hypothetical protein
MEERIMHLFSAQWPVWLRTVMLTLPQASKSYLQFCSLEPFQWNNPEIPKHIEPKIVQFSETNRTINQTIF